MKENDFFFVRFVRFVAFEVLHSAASSG